jgi:hypothetical protein
MKPSSLSMLAIVLVVAGCASYEPVPKDYVGPFAIVKDTGVSEDSSKAQFFALTTVDGQGIANAFSESARASAGRGATLVVVYPWRKLPVRRMTLGLLGSHATGAPIHAMASRVAGTFFSTEGVVEFTPKAEAFYSVKGELAKGRSCVWLEEDLSGLPVTEKVCSR